MASPLSPSPSATLNFSTPPTTKRCEKSEVPALAPPSAQNESPLEDDDSSPFITTVQDDEQENIISPSKSRHSRILSGPALSPLKLLQNINPSSEENTPSLETDKQKMPPPPSPRKISSPEKRFPVKISQPDETPRAKPTHQRQMSLEDAILENQGLKHAIDIFEDEVSVLENEEDDGDTIGFDVEKVEDATDEAAGLDDTMVSTFSTFSAVPNMTMFARLGQTPTLTRHFTGRLRPEGGDRLFDPAAQGEATPMRDPRSATPSHPHTAAKRESGNTTNLLMDFTENLRFPQGRMQSPSRTGRVSPTKGMPADALRTPQRQSIVNLLDFDIPPLPTPRSIPTVTPRELESLKSNFLSEISSLKASLSGKEAEALSLKTAVGDAEKRVGECMEQLREERDLREQLAAEKEGWERRGREMEAVLRKVKEEIVLSQREREELEAKLDEAEKRREAAEMMAQEAESKMAGMRAGKATTAAAATPDADKCFSPEGAKSPKSANQQVEIAVERVARELHALYKSKHETKVAALKKSYEGRWEKKVRELEGKVEDLSQENEQLRLGRDATMTRVEPAGGASSAATEGERKAQAARDSAQIKELHAEVEKLEAVVGTVQKDNADLRRLLEQERVEKGELVMLAEEMMSMQTFVGSSSSAAAAAAAPAHEETIPRRPAAHAGIPTSRTQPSLPTTARASGLKAPGSSHAGASRIGRAPVAGHHERKHSAGAASGVPRPGSGMGMRSGIMSSIEKMGSYRGRAD
ncbi:Kinetoplast-associated protein KAP [Pleurostoma richardsiae]|uniref:Kinetoplast-associated protein KAP n=1 Tax=Pleurostoma richardsiae TaxID=41990 RepID=A0AA38VWV9_9PEZI|nr:Kinetoplast-associated protein KAP [Pleurostoma richardsiae]